MDKFHLEMIMLFIATLFGLWLGKRKIEKFLLKYHYDEVNAVWMRVFVAKDEEENMIVLLFLSNREDGKDLTMRFDMARINYLTAVLLFKDEMANRVIAAALS